jgi:hypothetical protein
MYLEDDMIVSYRNFKKFTEKFQDLWPDYIPNFVRIETYDTLEEFTPDIMINITNDMVIEVKGKKYVKMPYHYNYHAFWILSKDAIKKSILEKGPEVFLNKPTAPEFREHCASFAIWTLNIPSLLSINKNNKLDRSCISYHLANNYQKSSKNISDIWKIH